MTTYPPTVSLKEAAELLKVHRTTALDLVKSGKIPAARVGRAYVMMTKDVLQYIENQIIDQTGERLSKRSPGGSPNRRFTRASSPSRCL